MTTLVKQKYKKQQSVALQHTWNIAQILIGSFILAASFNLFLAPSGIASGGVSGISILIQRLIGMEPAITQWIFNIPLFILALWLLGKRFAAKSLLGSLVFPLFVLLTASFQSPTDNPLLAALYGGIGVGAGLAIVFRGGGSTGGLDLLAQVMNRYANIKYNYSVALLDGIVIIAAAFVISPENSLYALISLYVTSKVIDFIQNGIQLSKVAFIISDHTDQLEQAILQDLNRGLTKLDARGGYTGEAKNVLMVVVSQSDVTRLKQTVARLDEKAFVIISDTTEVLGEGFNSYPSPIKSKT